MQENSNFKLGENSRFFEYPKSPIIGNRYQAYPLSPIYSPKLYQSPSIESNTYQTKRRHQEVQNCEGFFPFGRDREKLNSYVSQQMQPSVDEENKRTLEKFRIEAIKFRNQRVMKHLGKVPYLSESMTQGSIIDTTKLVEQPESKSVLPRRYHTIDTVDPIPPSFSPSSVETPVNLIYSGRIYPTEKKPKKWPENITREASVSVNFEKEFPLHLKKMRKKKIYTIEDFEEKETMNRIDNLLREMTSKMEKSNQVLARGVAMNPESQKPSSKKVKRRINFTCEENGENSSMFLKLSTGYDEEKSNKESEEKNTKVRYSKSLRNHMNLIKKSRNRIDLLTNQK